MKVRSGFVSNSSTSSFIIIGKPVSGDYEEMEAQAKKLGLDFEYGDGDSFIGALLEGWSDGDAADLKISLEDITATFSKVAQALNVPESEISLYGMTVAS